MSEYKYVKYSQETYQEHKIRDLTQRLEYAKNHAEKVSRELNTLRRFLAERKLIDEFVAWRVALRLEK